MGRTMRSWTIFLPAFCLYPIWLTVGIRDDILVSSVAKYYPMMVAMVIGSMIAGSTPLGGGVVAFPVSVLILGFTPAQGRDFSLMIQSVGMAAASFLIFYKKKDLLRGCEDILAKFCIWSLIGLIIGFECLVGLSPCIVNLVYTITVACIVFVLAYSDFVGRRRMAKCTKHCDMPRNDDGIQETSREVSGICDTELGNKEEIIDTGSSSRPEAEMKSESLKRRWITISLEYLCLPLFAIFGGILSSQIGSGADIVYFFYGSFYNAIICRSEMSKETEISENALTAASVIIMANTSIFGSIIRLTDSTVLVDDGVYFALVACAPIVVLGAPVGSLFLTPFNQQRLKYLFYVLGLVQLLSFGAIKIGNDYTAWIAVTGILTLVLTSLWVHNLFFSRSSKTTVA